MSNQSIQMNNNRGGNGRFGTLARKRSAAVVSEEQEFDYLNSSDRRMRFNNAQDPIYFAFDCLNNRSLPQLANDFVKDTFFEISNFISKVVK